MVNIADRKAWKTPVNSLGHPSDTQISDKEPRKVKAAKPVKKATK